jgi:hypothetical protein
MPTTNRPARPARTYEETIALYRSLGLNKVADSMESDDSFGPGCDADRDY